MKLTLIDTRCQQFAMVEDQREDLSEHEKEIMTDFVSVMNEFCSSKTKHFC